MFPDLFDRINKIIRRAVAKVSLHAIVVMRREILSFPLHDIDINAGFGFGNIWTVIDSPGLRCIPGIKIIYKLQ
jgi:hypothetical protein